MVNTNGRTSKRLDTIAAPGADRIVFWDHSALATAYLAVGNSIAITATTIDTIQDIRTTATPTFASQTLSATSNQVVLGSTRTITISAPTPATSSRTYTVSDFGADCVFALGTAGNNCFFTTTGATNVTLPTSGTLVNTGVTTFASLTSITSGALTIAKSGTGVTGTLALNAGLDGAPSSSNISQYTMSIQGAGGGTVNCSLKTLFNGSAYVLRATASSDFEVYTNESVASNLALTIFASKAAVFEGSILGLKSVVAHTEGVGSPYSVTAAESGRVFTNEGTTAKAYLTLPTAVAGYVYTVYCQDADGVRVTANTGDTIQVAGTVSGAAGYSESTTIGSSLILVAINATEWVAVSVVGTWSTV